MIPSLDQPRPIDEFGGRFGQVMEIVAGIGHNANMATRSDIRFGSTRLVSVIGWLLLGAEKAEGCSTIS